MVGFKDGSRPSNVGTVRLIRGRRGMSAWDDQRLREVRIAAMCGQAARREPLISPPETLAIHPAASVYPFCGRDLPPTAPGPC